jgi:tetratricopeptide (TPR) repeat protein
LVSSFAVALGLGVLVSLGSAAPAMAQSRRYPPPPVDKDAEKAAQSDLWNAAINPERHPYQDLVRIAAEALKQPTPEQLLEAIEKLDAAIRLLPHEADAYRLRGDAQLARRDWTRCAADFAAAEAYTQRDDEPPKAMAELRKKLGICQARAGKLSDAEKTLSETAASGNGSGEVWTRLGEVRIAMGKLDEAIAALRSALDTTEPAAQAMIRFMLAAAYDRARRPADALLEASEATKLDSWQNTLQNPSIPPLGAGELDYMFGLAYGVDPAKPEYQLAYFRRFIAAAPESPWRKRAEAHIRELRTSELPDTLMRRGPATPDLDAARASARRMMPQMRACLASHPAVVVEVEISRAGPRTPPATDRMRPRFPPPTDGITVRCSVGELSGPALEAIDRCLQPLAARLTIPAVKEHDTFFKVAFYVVGL